MKGYLLDFECKNSRYIIYLGYPYLFACEQPVKPLSIALLKHELVHCSCVWHGTSFQYLKPELFLHGGTWLVSLIYYFTTFRTEDEPFQGNICLTMTCLFACRTKPLDQWRQDNPKNPLGSWNSKLCGLPCSEETTWQAFTTVYKSRFYSWISDHHLSKQSQSSLRECISRTKWS